MTLLFTSMRFRVEKAGDAALDSCMTRLQEVEEAALTLPDAERAQLASHLLQTLPGVLADDDEGVAEALRRDHELEANPAGGVTWEEIKKGLGR